MTDLLSVEDIKKALGAFAGEQCAPPPLPSTLTHHPGPCNSLSMHPVGGALGGGGGAEGREWESSACPKLVLEGLGSVGKPSTLPRPRKTWGHQRLGGCAGRAGVPAKVEDRRPGSLWALRTSPLGGRRGCRRAPFSPTPYLAPHCGQGSSHPAVGRAGPTTVQTACPQGSEPFPRGLE